MTQTAIQDDLQCTNCGGQCVYSPKAKALECTSCSAQRKITGDPFGAAAREAAREFAYDPTQQDEPDLKHRTYVHHCMTCGGDVVFTGASLSDRCAYCDSAVVLATSDKAYASTAMIPFSVDQTTATQNARDWAKKRLAAPDDLGDVVDKARSVGIYVPFWTFDTQEAIKYNAKYRVKSGKTTYTRSTSGAFHMKFDDLLVPASPHVTPLIRDGILHDFDPERLRPYTPAYLAGFGAERHHQTVDEGLIALERDKDILIRNRILNKRLRGKRVIQMHYETDTSGIHYRRILLPVWIMHYTYDDIPKKIVVCGIHGRSFGERPFSMRKLALYAAAISLAVILFGIILGINVDDNQHTQPVLHTPPLPDYRIKR